MNLVFFIDNLARENTNYATS